MRGGGTALGILPRRSFLIECLRSGFEVETRAFERLDIVAPRCAQVGQFRHHGLERGHLVLGCAHGASCLQHFLVQARVVFRQTPVVAIELQEFVILARESCVGVAQGNLQLLDLVFMPALLLLSLLLLSLFRLAPLAGQRRQQLQCRISFRRASGMTDLGAHHQPMAVLDLGTAVFADFLYKRASGSVTEACVSFLRASP